ncbi:MAG TPA: zf-HC2 domain-containing protein [Pyrinomonadaceae bacterium]|jgi:anti-sigma factor RsiW
MRECLEEDVLQAYFDGELSSELMERTATHIAACAQCAEAARLIENESMLLAEAFAPEMALSVPTGRLRLRLDAAIAELESEQRATALEPRGSRLRSWLSAAFVVPFQSFTPQHAVGFASLVAVAALGLIMAFVVLRPRPVALSVAQDVKTPDLKSFEIKTGRDNNAGNQTSAPAKVNNNIASGVSGTGRQNSVNAGLRRPNEMAQPQPHAGPVDPTASEAMASVKLLPGERNYLKVIASLETAIKAGGDNALRPTLRAEYERNLQVVDEAIAQTRVVAQNNPNDKDAADFLLSAYQSKVDLMNTMAEQAQLSSMYR